MSDQTLDLHNSLGEPGRARAFVAGHLDAHAAAHPDLDEDLRADALLLVSELVTNVLQHGALPASLTMSFDARCLHVDVQDEGLAVPTGPQAADPARASGRGLVIVDAIAASWGIREFAGHPGKTVWFELPVN